MPARGRRRGELDGRSIVVRRPVGVLRHRAAAACRHGQADLVDGERRGDRRVVGHRDHQRIRAAGGVAAPAHEVVAGRRHRGQRHRRAVGILGLVGIDLHQTAPDHGDVEGVGVDRERRGERAVSRDDQRERVRRSAGVAAPAHEVITSRRHGGQRHARAVGVDREVRVLRHGAAARRGHRQGVGVDREAGEHRLVGIHDERHRAGAARDIAGPLDEVIAGVGNRGERDGRAVRVQRLIGALGDAAVPVGGGGQRVGVDRERRRERAVPRHDQRQRIGGGRGVAAPAHEVIAGRRRRGERHARPVIVRGLVGSLGHRAVDGSVHGHGVGVDRERRDERAVPRHDQRECRRRGGRIAAPPHEVVARRGRGRQRHRGAIVVAGLVRVLRDRAAGRSAHVEGVGVDRERRRDGLVPVHRHLEGVGRARRVAAPAHEVPAHGRGRGERHHRPRRVARLIGVLGHRPAAAHLEAERPGLELVGPDVRQRGAAARLAVDVVDHARDGLPRVRDR